MTAALRNRRWLILAVILVAECMDLLDSTVVNVAAPAIHAELGTSSTALQWIVGGYPLALAVGLIVGGRLGDLFGRGRLFIIGVAGFTIASMACGLAPTTGFLIAARLVQGAAAALMLPQGLGLIREVFPTDELGKAFGVFGPVIGSAAVVGPIVGGGLIALNLFGTGWRLIFFVNFPLGIAAVVGGLLLLPLRAPATRERLDLLGVALSGLGALALVYPLMQGRDLGWPWWTWLLMGLSALLFAAFGWQQARRARSGADPLVLPSVFTHRGYSAGLVVMTVFFAGMGGVLLATSVFLQIGQHFSAIHTGIMFIPMSAALAVGAGLSGAVLGPRFGRSVILAGAVINLAGWLLVERALHATGTIGFVSLLPGLAVVGLGMGLVVAPLFDVILASVTDAETGSASGLLNAVQQLAGAVGVAVFGSIFFSAVTTVGFRSALERMLWVQIAALAVMAVLTLLLPAKAREEDPAALAAEPASDPVAAVGAATLVDA